MLAVRLVEFTNTPGAVHPGVFPRPVPANGQVLVEVKAAGINPSDLLNIRGGFDHTVLPRIVGRDFAGRVVEGPAHLRERDVFGSGGGELGYTVDGTHAQFLVLDQGAVALRPPSLPVDLAATAGVPFVTAWHALVERAHLSRDAWVIVSGAAGAVGNAAIQIAHYAGAHVVALVKDDSELPLLDRGKIAGVAHSDKGDLGEVVRKATGGEGCDIALNTVGSPIFHELLDALRLGGRQAVISGVGGREVTFDLKNLYRRDYSVIGVNSANLTAVQSAQMLTEMSAGFDSGQMQPQRITDRVPLERANDAYAKAEAANSKVVLLME